MYVERSLDSLHNMRSYRLLPIMAAQPGKIGESQKTASSNPLASYIPLGERNR